ncbi:MAG: Mur ligase family protein [Boseongicola sp.]
MSIWRHEARLLLDSVGWGQEKIAMRAFDGGATLQISAPMDALYAATDIIEASWVFAEELLNGDDAPDRDTVATRIRDKIAAESDPALASISAEATTRGVTFLGHDDAISVGLGRGVQVWNQHDMPSVGDVPWDDVHDVPVAMVTGTNGKSTTVRLAAAIGAAAGKCVGMSSSDWVRVGDEIVDEGDYSGPAGARLAVRDRRVDLAIIETARGGLMRRGLPVPRADACLLTNIAADHLGGYGITDVPALADAKFQIADAVRPGGRLILNADDPELVSRSARFGGKITWFGLEMEQTARSSWISQGGHAVFVEAGQMMLARDYQEASVLPVADFGPAMGGAAKFNVSNALAAIALADALDLPVAAMADGLASFTSSPEENPGRGNLIRFGGITLLLDFAHNPHGVAALSDAVQGIPAKRRLFLAGQAGDRSDDDTRELTRAIWNAKPDMVVIKELPTKLRGRNVGELSAIIDDELTQLGANSSEKLLAKDEFEAVKMSLRWAGRGDLLVLLLHDDRKPTMNLINELQNCGWQAGDPLPETGE